VLGESSYYPSRSPLYYQFGGTSQLAIWVLSFGGCGLAGLGGAAATIFLPRNIWQR
jgi:hypothetical protein